MGKKIVLTGVTLTDLDAPKLAQFDPIESAGSLLLIEPMHPYQQWPAGVPADAALLPNILTTLAGGPQASFSLKGGINNGTKGKLERSGKGGLHGIVSQSSLLTTTDGALILLPSSVRAYIYAHQAHDYYFSFWDRLTRANPNATQWTADYALGSNTSVGLAYSNPNGWMPGTPSLKRDTPNVVGPRFANVSRDATLVSAPTHLDSSGTPIWGTVMPATYNGQVIATRNDNWTSFVFYRCYLEDLTVSGRTYAEVDALDYALYTKHVLTAGGRYYGDTFTDPATIA